VAYKSKYNNIVHNKIVTTAKYKQEVKNVNRSG